MVQLTDVATDSNNPVSNTIVPKRNKLGGICNFIRVKNCVNPAITKCVGFNA